LPFPLFQSSSATLLSHYNKQQNTAAAKRKEREREELPRKDVFHPLVKEDKLFLPARRETVIKFHEFRAPVNVGRVKSKFKLCRKSDPIPLSLSLAL